MNGMLKLINNFKFVKFLAALALTMSSSTSIASEDSPSMVVKASAIDFVPPDFITVVIDVGYMRNSSPEEIQTGVLTVIKGVVASLAEAGGDPINIRIGERSPSRDLHENEGKDSLFSIHQQISVDIFDTSKLQLVLAALVNSPDIRVTNLQPRLLEPEKHFDKVIQQAVKAARQIAIQIGEGLNISVGKILGYKKSAELAAYPLDRIMIGGKSYGEGVNLLNEPLKLVELKANVEVSFSMVSVN